jgi:hypothetical protein
LTSEPSIILEIPQKWSFGLKTTESFCIGFLLFGQGLNSTCPCQLLFLITGHIFLSGEHIDRYETGNNTGSDTAGYVLEISNFE